MRLLRAELIHMMDEFIEISKEKSRNNCTSYHLHSVNFVDTLFNAIIDPCTYPCAKFLTDYIRALFIHESKVVCKKNVSH